MCIVGIVTKYAIWQYTEFLSVKAVVRKFSARTLWSKTFII